MTLDSFLGRSGLNSPKTGKRNIGIAFKVIALGIVPVVLMSGLNLFSSQKSARIFGGIMKESESLFSSVLKENDTLFGAVLDNIAREDETARKISTSANSVKDGMLSLIAAMNKSIQNHQKGLLSKDSGSTDMTLKLRAEADLK